jgi:peptidoglycan hydrolase-like protein with peptidoglycan-binding domain
MGNIKASAYIPVLESHLGDGYVYGTVGQICTVSLLQAKYRQYGKIMSANYYQKNGDYTKGLCARWLGRWVADCSGLIKAVRRDISGVYRDVSAQGTYEQCSQKGKIATMPLVPGCTVYMWSTSKKRMGHVGMYVGDGKVIESAGVNYGVIRTDLKKRSWGYWGLLDWLDLDLPQEGGGAIPDPGAQTGGSDGADQLPDDRPCSGVPALEALGDTGYGVLLMQQWLNLHGAMPALEEDGIFGPLTEAAVIAFKQANGRPADGVSCIKTWSLLIVPPPAVPLELKTIQTGSEGILVTLLQRLLYTAGASTWDIDGKFSAQTAGAVKEFQKTRRLTVDGIVGPQTWGALTDLLSALPRTVNRGDTGDEVTEVQRLLTNLLYQPGPIDGDFGPLTETAVVAFQKANGLKTDGVVGPLTWTKLLSPGASEGAHPLPPTVKYGDSNDIVKQLQAALNFKGASPALKADGIFGPLTLAAVKAFQKANGLAVDGIVGPITWGKLLG